ncbi:hypothetical protein Gbfr_009_024 [Gluconobacter frateurii M-2]|nr:hypothetical protein Gbfr_009_024 [Gluconobacter frateurii M-2]
MGFKINTSVVASALAMATPFVTGLLANKGAAYQKIANQAVRSAVTSTDGGIDKLVATFKTFESEQPLVQTAVTEFVTLAKAAGFNVPSLDAVQSHIKSAIYDLATAFVSEDEVKPVVSASDAAAS